MSHPAYHLRPNKAVDRLAFIDAIRCLDKIEGLSKYTYYGFGGPYLEDFRLLYELCPEVKMVSIEADEETYKRQQFHLPCGAAQLRSENNKFEDFLAQYTPNDEKSVFWLDYTKLEYREFDEFMTLLGKVSKNSMVKITLHCEPRNYITKLGEIAGSGPNRFRTEFREIMPNPDVDPPRDIAGFAALLQNMVQVAAQKALPNAMPLTFLPVSSFYYADGAPIFTFTGIVCRRDARRKINKAFRNMPFANMDWVQPKHIDVPVLSTKERLYLQTMLPCASDAGGTLRRTLGYRIEDNEELTDRKLAQYAEFHRYYPYFMRAVP